MKYILIVILLIFASCEEPREKADLIVINANIYTVDKAFSKATAIAVRDGKFLAVDSARIIRETYEADLIIDAEGKTMVPGLIDAHCHFYGLGLAEQQVNLNGTKSFAEVLNRVNRYYAENNPAQILGRGWDQNDWEVKEFPTREKLDSLYPEIPVVLERVDGHAFLVNQKMLHLAGIDEYTEAIGGEIIKDSGIPTGVLIDGPQNMVTAALPKPDLQTRIRALKNAERICFNNGLTTVNDAGLSWEVVSLIDSLQRVGELTIRVYAMISANRENLDLYLPRGPIKTDKLNVRSVKVYADGALGSRGAALKEPYSDLAAHYGAMVTPVQDIETLAMRIVDSEFQMNTHAIGDSANSVVLKAYQKALQGTDDRRWKIEHAQVIDPNDFDYFTNGIIPSVQPTHATSDMYWAEDRLGEERIKGAYAFKTLLDRAGMLALGTDFPVEAVNPFYTFYAAVARKDLNNYPEEGFEVQEALSREDALKGMTIWAAYSNFEEMEKGSIEVGKMADFVILNKDLMKIPEEELPTLKAEHVVLGGRIAE
ncbi:MAG: amidohydrolase [Flavobacteriaceae bacterium]